MKKIKYIFAILIMVVSINKVCAFDNKLKIYDYAQTLTEKEEIKLKENVDKYINRYNIDMVIVTVKHYLQNELDEYMELFYKKNNFGIGPSKDGILVVFDLKNTNDKIGIKAFGKGIDLYSEIEIDNMLNKINREKTYYKKLNTFIDESNHYIDKFDKISIEKDNTLLLVNYPLIIIISLIISVCVIMIGLIKGKTKNKMVVPIENNMYINKKEDKYITTNTKKER